jgi:hypothetical protein
MVVMVWALAAIIVLAVGLPIAGWLLSRGMAAKQTTQSPGGLGPPTDAADKWLIERHKLPALQRWRVRQAVVAGGQLHTSPLRDAAHDLAGGVLRGEVQVGRTLRAVSWILLAEGICFAVAGTLIAIKIAPAGIGLVVLGVWFLIKGTRAVRMIRHGPSRAYQRNA